MRNIFTSSCLLLLIFCAPSAAQVVPPSTQRQIVAELKTQRACSSEYTQFNVYGVKVGPNKNGFVGSCLYGGGIYVVYENRPRGLSKLFQVSVPMNFEILV